MNKEYNINKRVNGSNCKKFKGKVALTFYFLLSTFFCSAQDSIRISGQFLNNTKFAKVVIQKFGIGVFDIAAVPIEKETGKFSITAPIDVEPGVYRLQYSQIANEFLDVIINGKEKSITFSVDLLNENEKRKPIFTQSQENQNWYGYQNQSQLQLQKIVALQQAIALYPNTTDKIVAQLQKVVTQEQKKYQKQEATFIKKYANTWAASMVQNKPVYFTNPKEEWRIQDRNKIDNYWNIIQTNNPQLINTPLYTEHILEYLKYYMNPEMHFTDEEMNAGFVRSVDIIIQKFSTNEATKKFALQYLQLGFKELGNEKVLQYIDEKYQELAAQCQDETDKAAFDKRMAGYATIKVGNKAPDITFINLDFNLHEVAAERIILVFWASWCPHCMEELPKLNEWAAENSTTKVVAISLDDDKTAYEIAIQKFPALIHDCDFKKWDGKAVNDYYVYGTPTFLVLDKDKNILGKHTSFEQLKTFINKN
jgi:thiol-disulfide isomerase/thioredoxin